MAILVSLALALLLFATTGISQAQATNAYEVEPWAEGCGSGQNSGSYDSDGTLYVVCGDLGRKSKVLVYDKDGNKQSEVPLEFYAADVAPAPGGQFLYVTVMEPHPNEPGEYRATTPKRLKKEVNGTYTVESNATWALSRYDADGTGWWITKPSGVYIDTDDAGNIYLAEGAFTTNLTQVVVKYTPDGKTVLTRFGGQDPDRASSELGTFNQVLNGLVVSPDGSKVYTVESHSSRVQRWERQGATATSSYASKAKFGEHDVARSFVCDNTGELAAPYDIELTNEGGKDYLYVLNTHCGEVLKYDANTAFTDPNHFVAVGQLGASPKPHGFAVSKDGNRVYIGQSGKMMRATGGDTTAPTVTSMTPPNGATGVSVSAEVTATFSEAMNASTISGTTFTLKKDGAATVVTAAVTYDATNKRAILKPNASLDSGVPYTATLSGVRDMAGNALPVKTWTFTTASGPEPPPGTCGGKAATAGVSSSIKPDGTVVLTGTDGPDVIIGNAGSDQIFGEGGNDTICGGGGFDTISGGPGDDALDGGTGPNGLEYGPVANAAVNVNLATGKATGEGADTLANFNEVYGSPQADTIVADGAVNFLAGNGGNDKLHGSGGNDLLRGGDGYDTLQGGAGNDTLEGQAGGGNADYADAPSGVVVNLKAGSASGGAGSDKLVGIADATGSRYNDTIVGSFSSNSFVGGVGVDTASYAGSAMPVKVDLSVTTNQATGQGNDYLAGMENLTGSAYADTLIGNGLNNVLAGGNGTDKLYGRLGNDGLNGGLGADYLYGEGGNDSLNSRDGANGNDYLNGGAGTDTKTTDATEKPYVGFP